MHAIDNRIQIHLRRSEAANKIDSAPAIPAATDLKIDKETRMHQPVLDKR